MKLKTRDMRWGNENPYLFLENLEFVESDTECLGEFQLREKVNSHKKFEGKLKSFWKLTLKRKTRVFRDWGELPTSRQGKLPKQSKSKLWKKFLSVFHNWKVYPQGSRKLSRKNLCVPFMTGPFTHEQVAKINTQTRYWSMRLGWPMTESTK